MIRKIIQKWPLIFVIYWSMPLFGVDIGSDTAVTRFNTQQLVQGGDRIAGFAALDAGFLMDSIVTATFDSFFPVSGELDFNFATLVLNQDLILHNLSSIGHWGNITGQGHIFELSENSNCLPTLSGASLCSVTLVDEDIEGAKVNTVHFSYDSLYLIEGEGNSFGVDLVVNESSLVNEDTDNLGQEVKSIDWHPSQDWIAVGTKADIADPVYTYTFSRATSTLTQLDSVAIGDDVSAVAWHPDGGHLGVVSKTDDVIVYVIDSSGNFGASTTVALSEEPKTLDWNSDGSFLVVGTKDLGGWDELRVYSFTKSPLGLSLDASFNTVDRINSVSWNKGSSADDEIAVGLRDGANRLRLFRHTTGTLTELTTGIAVSPRVNTVDWHPCGCCLAAGLDQNAVGTGGELRTYSFHSDDTLTQADDHELDDDVLSVSWSPNGRLLAVGDDGVGAGDPKVSLYQFDSEFIGDIDRVIFDELHMRLQGNSVFDFTAIEFTGESSIDGRHNILSFSPSFTLIIGSNSSLLIKNVTLAGVNGRKMRLTDNTSTVSFQRVKMAIDDDFTFDTGSFDVLDEFIIQGDHKFIYQSPCTSRILSRLPEAETIGDCQAGYSGHFIMDHNTTFSYDSTLSSTLIEMEDEYAKFSFNSATLAVTSSFQLTRGRLFFDGKCSLLCGEGLIFGDGTEAGNLYVEELPAAQIDVESGFLIDNNV